MIDILRGLTGSGLPFLFAWVLPSAIASAAFALLVLPSIDHFPVLRDIASLSGPSQALILSFAAVTLALVMNALDTPAYRLLEGYSWPSKLQDRGVRRQTRRKEKLEARRGKSSPGWRQDLADEQLERFPVGGDLAPTALGNALRAFENYGLDRYNLNSQLMWAPLYSSISEDLRAEYERSRAAVDFFVASFYLSALFAVLSFAAAVSTVQVRLLIPSGIALSLAPFQYAMAWRNTSYWARTTRAIVDIGRRDLATRLNLQMPATTEDERRMWGVVNAFVYYPYEELGGKALDEFRVKRDPPGG